MVNGENTVLTVNVPNHVEEVLKRGFENATILHLLTVVKNVLDLPNSL